MEVELSKKCTALWHEAHFEVDLARLAQKSLGALLEVDVEKCTQLWRESHFEVKSVKN